MVTVSILLSVLFVSEAGFTGALASCGRTSSINITAPVKMEALTGSCLLIPCNFEENSGNESRDSRRTGVWIKEHSRFRSNPDNVIFNSSSTVRRYPMNITGNLSQKNCTTLFSNLITKYTDKYFFRIEMGSFKATAVCNPLQINVQDSPPTPTVEISGDQREGVSVTVTCSAQTPCPQSPPKLTWNLQQDPHNIMEENTDQTFTTKTQRTITLSEKDDGHNVTCSASYPVNDGRDVKRAEVTTTLSVSYGPKDTSASISPSGLVSAGSWVNLTCSSRAKPPISHFIWLEQSTDGVVNVSEGALYSFRATYGAVYFCVASNDVGNQTSSKVHLSLRGERQQWELVLGGIIVFVILICLIVLIWRLKFTHSTAQQTQSQTYEEVAMDRKTEEENIHYGDIDFSRLRPGPSSDSLQDSGQQQNCVYAQVNVSKTAKKPRHTADSPEDLYAQVMKK